MNNRDGLKSDMTVASWLVAFCGVRGLGGLTNGSDPANSLLSIAPCKPSKPLTRQATATLDLIRTLGTTTPTPTTSTTSTKAFPDHHSATLLDDRSLSLC
jgi:hypothetical protein